MARLVGDDWLEQYAGPLHAQGWPIFSQEWLQNVGDALRELQRRRAQRWCENCFQGFECLEGWCSWRKEHIGEDGVKP